MFCYIWLFGGDIAARTEIDRIIPTNKEMLGELREQTEMVYEMSFFLSAFEC